MESEDKSEPVIIVALGIITKGSDQNLRLLAARLSATELQKVALMSTAHSTGKCWGNRFDLLLRSAITGTVPTEN